MLAKMLQSYPTLCNPIDCSPPGTSVHGILQTRILERVAMSCSRGSSRPRDGTRISEVSCIGRSVLDHQCQLGISAIKMFSPSTVVLIVTDWKEGAFIRTLNLQHYFLMSYHSACSILTIQKVSLLTPLSCGEHRACSNKQSGVKLPAENQTRKLTFHVHSQQWGRS